MRKRLDGAVDLLGRDAVGCELARHVGDGPRRAAGGLEYLEDELAYLHARLQWRRHPVPSSIPAGCPGRVDRVVESVYSRSFTGPLEASNGTSNESHNLPRPQRNRGGAARHA